MSVCPVCGTPIADTSGEYYITLEIEDMTRSTRQFMGDETPVTRICTHRQVCADCWDDLSDVLGVDE